MKKVVSILLLILATLFSFPLSTVYAEPSALSVDIHSLTIDKTEIEYGESTKITIEIPNNTTVDNYHAYVDMHSHNSSQQFSFTYNPKTKLYEAILSPTFCGEWEITKIDIYDELGNQIVYTNSSSINHPYPDNFFLDPRWKRANLSSYNLIVKPTSSMVANDTIAPQLTRIYLDKENYTIGDTVTVYCEIADENELAISESDMLDNRLSYRFPNQDESFFYDIPLKKTDTKGLYKSTIAVPYYGEYKFLDLCMTDVFGNGTYLRSSQIENSRELSFAAESTGEDSIAPQIDLASIKLSKEYIKPNEPITFSCHITDDSDIVSLTAYFESTDGKYSESFSYYPYSAPGIHDDTVHYDSVTNTFEITITPKNAGHYSLSLMQVTDVYANSSVIESSTENLSGFQFDVAGSPYTPQLGDLDGDTEITPADCMLLARHIANIEPLADTDLADVNGDGEVNAKDLTALAGLLNQ